MSNDGTDPRPGLPHRGAFGTPRIERSRSAAPSGRDALAPGHMPAEDVVLLRGVWAGSDDLPGGPLSLTVPCGRAAGAARPAAAWSASPRSARAAAVLPR